MVLCGGANALCARECESELCVSVRVLYHTTRDELMNSVRAPRVGTRTCTRMYDICRYAARKIVPVNMLEYTYIYLHIVFL